ncbi:MAG: hypothetical protein A2015_04830 [Spirochaetes bacterium GWF1_31_7]|nr:MAG: hypothetical protein A2Y30_05210 [Spirochaetes bacterium GWE1_32_154]OHD48792.1 MAG: hypothetical protein A2Y29_03190 [Spirochaetes bacterium GWE2_31_10]OHD52855.1 MAG: hypothetical protein A2015_04830 [Spirochaetes bacterium GWF1_31_7]HBD93141.1 hypothetical protein [Spirochaetia bacterium]HBI37529.1 hypothetical protein [Spirochaetia bacterium]
MNLQKLIALFIVSCFTLNAQVIDEKPSITFNVVVEKEIEASVLILNLKIEKKDKDFKNGSAEVSKAITKLTQALLKAGLKENEIITDKFNLIPDTTWWNSKEYTVKTIIKAKITNKELIYPVFTVAGSIDPLVSIEGFDYDYGNLDTVKNDLIQVAGEKAQLYRLSYEKSFGVKLSVFSVSVNDELNEAQNVYKNYSLANVRMDSSMNDAPHIAQLPVKKMRMSFFMRYLIGK